MLGCQRCFYVYQGLGGAPPLPPLRGALCYQHNDTPAAGIVYPRNLTSLEELNASRRPPGSPERAPPHRRARCARTAGAHRAPSGARRIVPRGAARAADVAGSTTAPRRRVSPEPPPKPDGGAGARGGSTRSRRRGRSAQADAPSDGAGGGWRRQGEPPVRGAVRRAPARGGLPGGRRLARESFGGVSSDCALRQRWRLSRQKISWLVYGSSRKQPMNFFDPGKPGQP